MEGGLGLHGFFGVVAGVCVVAPSTKRQLPSYVFIGKLAKLCFTLFQWY